MGVEEKEYPNELERRINIGAGETAVFLPFIGEFGHLILTGIRIPFFSKAKTKIICCRPNETVFFPNADAFDFNWADPCWDRGRVGTMRTFATDWTQIKMRYRGAHFVPGGHLSWDEELICLEPKIKIPFKPKPRGLNVDVCLGVRHRAKFEERNWPKENWQMVADAITASGKTFAVIGQRPTTLDLIGQKYHSGDYPDSDATVELLQNCGAYLGTDTGPSHLAATVGVPMLIWRETAGESRDLTPRMQLVNPAPVQVVPGGWENVGVVLGAFREMDKAANVGRN